VVTIRNLPTSPIARGLIVFLFFGLADLFLTWKLIDRESSDVIESNPLAAFVLTSYGWLGLAVYKFALVLTFLGLAMMIERRRPTGGLLLLVFACGVNAAVVTTSAFMFLAQTETRDYESDQTAALMKEQRHSLPDGALELLCQQPVQEELRLSDYQIAELTDLANKRQDLSRDLQLAHLSVCRSKMMLISALEDGIFRDMTSAQYHRLRQLTLQWRGARALVEPDVAAALRLSEAQIHAIDDLLKVRPANAQAGEANRMLLGALTDNQLERWQAIQGAPFDFRTNKSAVMMDVE